MGGDRRVAELAGEEQSRAHGLELPADPRVVAEAVGVLVVEKSAKGGVSGMLMRVGESYVIAYAAHLPNEGFQRFSIAHELGHYFLPGHLDHVLDANGVHESRGPFTSKAPHEIEADAFAVGLLLPRTQFLSAMSTAGEGLAAIEALASRCRTSVTATAIRFSMPARGSALWSADCVGCRGVAHAKVTRQRRTELDAPRTRRSLPRFSPAPTRAVRDLMDLAGTRRVMQASSSKRSRAMCQLRGSALPAFGRKAALSRAANRAASPSAFDPAQAVA